MWRNVLRRKNDITHMNITKMAGAALVMAALSAVGNADDCDTIKRVPNCKAPFATRTCVNKTINVSCRWKNDMKHYVCNTNFIKFVPDTQMDKIPTPNTGNTSYYLFRRCGWKKTGNCTTGPSETCTLSVGVEIEGFGWQAGREIQVNMACFEIDQNEPEEVGGGVYAWGQPNPNCTNPPPVNPGGNPKL